MLQPAVADAPNPSRIVSPCAWYGWDEWVGEGTLIQYAVWIASPPGAEPELVGATDDNKYRVCNEEFGTQYEMMVQAVTSAGTSVLSEPSIPYGWVHSGDFDENGITGWVDFGIFNRMFATPNNGVQELDR
jgi:hypothetical protein